VNEPVPERASPGVYEYHCEIHATTMVGRIACVSVRAAAG
jgi:plastocyanin